MKLFVTGGTGFLGSHFVRAAIAAGHEVNALRRQGTGARSPLPLVLRWIEAPMDAVPEDAFLGCEMLVHFAAAGVSPQKATTDELFRVNVSESLSLWQNAISAGIRRLVICGTCFEYGAAAERYDRIRPDAPLEPVTAYGASKAAGTMAAMALAAEKRCEVTILRPFTAYGDGQHESNFWPALRKAAISGQDFPMTAGEQMRDFVSAEEVASQFLGALKYSQTPGETRIANVGSGKAQTLRQFAEFWWSEFGATGRLKIGELPYRPGEVMRYVPAL
jgi:nucleoside-diphosphate-sugar epimerase